MSPNLPDIESARFKMIEQQIRPWNVLDGNVLELLSVVRREDFVPQTHRHLAFVDMEIPLPENQVMLAPKVQARLLQELNLSSTDKVLEIGTGSGYMTALMARLSAHVLSIDKYEALTAMAQDNLAKAEITNVELVTANGLMENPRWAHVGFDAIAITGAIHAVPAHLLERLNPAGRLVAIVGEPPVMQAVLIERADARHSNSGMRTTTLFETLTKPLEDAPKVSRFHF